jgi:hypothetical protein
MMRPWPDITLRLAGSGWVTLDARMADAAPGPALVAAP